MNRAKAILRGWSLAAGVATGQTVAQRWMNSAYGAYEIGAWLRSQKLRVPKRVEDRSELFELAAQDLESCDSPLYLEFGVYQGASLRWWTQRMKSSSMMFFGFDSFQGLPQDWTLGYSRGHFATIPPVLEDPRVRLLQGWFDESLPHFEVPVHDKLFVTFDADLYSSTSTVLRHLGQHLQAGDFLYFDELPLGEHRALIDYVSETSLRLIPIGTTRNYVQWLFVVADDLTPAG